MASRKARIRLTAIGTGVGAILLGAWPVWIVLRKEVHLIDKNDPLRPGLGARGAYTNTGSRDMGPDPRNPHVKERQKD